MIMGAVIATESLNIPPIEKKKDLDGEIKFVPTWKNKKKAKELTVGIIGNPCKHDLIRCSMCNAPTIIKVPLENTQLTAQCPHCESPEGLTFPHLVDGGDIQVVFPRKEHT